MKQSLLESPPRLVRWFSSPGQPFRLDHCCTSLSAKRLGTRTHRTRKDVVWRFWSVLFRSSMWRSKLSVQPAPRFTLLQRCWFGYLRNTYSTGSFWITEQTQVRQLRPSNGVPKFFPQVQGLAAGVQTLGLVVVKCRVFWTGFIAILGEPVGGPHRNKTVSRFLSIFVNVSTCFYLFGDCPWACHGLP